jgi:hypothetical protein
MVALRAQPASFTSPRPQLIRHPQGGPWHVARWNQLGTAVRPACRDRGRDWQPYRPGMRDAAGYRLLATVTCAACAASEPARRAPGPAPGRWGGQADGGVVGEGDA